MPNICVVTIFVADMETAKDFYETKLGFVVQKEYSKEIIQITTGRNCRHSAEM
ncbi:VOC family protein [Lysinibacillus fusiformis]|nr:VOC family protein [Lysinibacillus fusiformis]